LHVGTLTIPRGHTIDSERVAQVLQPRLKSVRDAATDAGLVTGAAEALQNGGGVHPTAATVGEEGQPRVGLNRARRFMPRVFGQHPRQILAHRDKPGLVELAGAHRDQ
jgi:hypothetical protein